MTYNAAQPLHHHALRTPEREAMQFEQTRWTYADLDDAVTATASVLRRHGIEAGDRVALLGMNSDEYVVALLALSRITAVAVPLNYRLHPEEMAFLVDDAGAVAVLVDGEYGALVDDLVAAMPECRLVAGMHGEVAGATSLAELRVGVDGDYASVAAPADADTLDRILYTSGTTSRPKGVMLTHGNAAWNTLVQVTEDCLRRDERTLAFAPLYHIGAQELPGLRTFAVGASMVVMRRFDPAAVLDAVDAYQITGMCMVASMVHIMRELPTIADFDTGSVRWLVFSQVPIALFDDLREIFPNAALRNSYGLTETCSTVSALDPAHERIYPAAPGRASQHVEVRIVDDDDVALGPDELGEIVVRSPKVMAGYWQQPELTAEVMRGGWLHTGDVGRLNADGYLTVVDRKKDMIRSGGENVASPEIERVIHELDEVAECAVVGVPDPKWLEVPKAFVVVRPDAELDTDRIIAHCRDRLASFKVPKQVEFRDELPRNPSGKVLKRELRDGN